ncbi:MAG: metallophosphoesterase, partial [Myxococcota bacterium]
AQHIHDHPADALILVGDLGHDPDSLHRLLDLFSDTRGPTLAVPGNHDVWLTGWEDHTDSSWELHEHLLPEAFQAHGVHPLHLKPFTLTSDDDGEQVTFVGSMGWYDYSFRDDIGIELEAYQTKTPPWSSFPIWNDARFARFDQDDVALTRLLNTRLAQQLHDTPEQTPVVAAIHHLTSRRLLVQPREMVPKRWRYANAFLGADCLGDTLVADPRVTQVFCGHIHMARHITVRGHRWSTIGSDYRTKQLIRATADRIVEVWDFGPEAVMPSTA